MSPELVVTVAHELPGRIRLRLSRPSLTPAALEQAVGSHPGFTSVGCSPISGSVLVHHEPDVVRREEVLFRVALAFSLEHGGATVRLLPQGAHEEMSDSAYGAAAALLVAAIGRWFAPTRGATRWLEGGASLLTAWSVVQHGADELRQRGHFDPEVLSLAYLLVSLLRGQPLAAAALTWLATFGRHLASPRQRGVLLSPEALGAGQPGYRVVMRPASAQPGQRSWRDLLPALLRYGLGGMSSIEDSLLQRVRELSSDHDDVLEGLGDLQVGVPIQIEQ